MSKKISEKEINDRKEKLKEIRDEVINFTVSDLCKERIKNKTFPVLGEGSHFADIVFIGEAPGKNESMTGRPFVGASGKVLDELLLSAGIPREDVYITNIVKDRPPQNRDPLPEEIEMYAPFLDRQIEIIQPKVIATLGRFAMMYIMKRYGLESKLDLISNIHGKIFEAKTPYGKVKMVPLYHPAVAVYNNKTKDSLKEDFQTLKQFI
ncbi:MAG: uracil-DNA glycosylase [Candidatus Paceibacterota bacterium]